MFFHKKKMLLLFMICCMVSLSMYAVSFSYTAPLFDVLDPVSEALGGTGIGDPNASFLLNPVNATSENVSLSLPWAAVRMSRPYPTYQSMRSHDWNTIAWNLPAGNSEVFSAQAGAGSQFKHFAFDVRGGVSLLSLSYANEEGGALMSDVFANIHGSLSVAGGGKLIYKMRHSFAWGIGTGVNAVLWTEPVSAVSLSQKGFKEGVLKDTPLYTEASVPVSLGFSYSYSDMITLAGTVRNDSFLLFFRNTFLDRSVAKDKFKNHFIDLFAGSMGINLLEGWTGDMGLSLKYKIGDWSFKALADIHDIMGLVKDSGNSLCYIRGGLEATVNGISLRAGFNRGITAGIGLDMQFMFLDIAVTRLLFPYPGESASTYMSMKARIGF